MPRARCAQVRGRRHGVAYWARASTVRRVAANDQETANPLPRPVDTLLPYHRPSAAVCIAACLNDYRNHQAPRYWLMKSEPDECSIDDALAGRRRHRPLDWRAQLPGAQLHARRDDVGDGVLFYHSSCPEPGIVGICARGLGRARRPRSSTRNRPIDDP